MAPPSSSLAKPVSCPPARRLANGKVRIVDKLLGNFLRVGLIRLMLPNARIIHTMRATRIDTCVSCYSKLFSKRSLLHLRSGGVGPLLPRLHRTDGSLAIGSAARRHARRQLRRRSRAIWKAKPAG